MADLRLNTALPRHPKTRKLARQLGSGAAWSLVVLWTFAAEHRTDGDLSGLDDDDIELAADWTGEPGVFVAALVALRWLDGEPGARCLHDWICHQPWVAGAADRSDSARWAALCRRYGRAGAATRMPDYAARMRPAEEPKAERVPSQCDPSAPSPSPSPYLSVGESNTRLEDLEGREAEKTYLGSGSMRPKTPPDAGTLPTATYRGAACVAMRQAGIAHTNPSHADLLAAEREGVPIEVWGPTAAECIERGKGQFAYVIAVARRRHAEGAAVIPIGSSGVNGKESVAERGLRVAMSAQALSPDRLIVGGAP